MNITTNYSNVSIVTTNPATDSAARDSAVRPVVPPVATTSATNSETTSDRERQQSTASVIPSKDPTYEQPQNAAVNTAEINGEDANNTEVNEQDASQEQDGDRSDNDSDENRNKNEEFTEKEQEEIEELKSRDTEVVTHELAHAGAGGQYAGSPSYTYETGPDGVRYAVSGEVSIDTSKIEGDPEATLLKAQQIKRAALAPAEPSGQDRSVAASAEQLASEARQELAAANSAVEESEETDRLKADENAEADSVNESSSSVEDDIFQQTIANRSQHINNFYQQSSQASERSSFQQQI